MTVLHDDTIAGWPTQTEAARLLRLSESTLSRYPQLEVSTAGRERRIAPESVLAMGARYKKVPLGELASALLQLAEGKAPGTLLDLEERLERMLERLKAPQPDSAEIRAMLERSVSPKMLKEIIGVIERSSDTSTSVESRATGRRKIKERSKATAPGTTAHVRAISGRAPS